MSLTEDEQKCLDKLSWATRQLAVEVSEAELTSIAQVIIECMTGRWRCFHTPSHLFSVANCGTAIEVLAGLFHDVVYVQVDQGINLNLSYYLAPFVKEHQGTLIVREQNFKQKDLILEIVLSIFGFAYGQNLSPYAGQNEFLSALAGAKILESFLPPKIIAQIVTCIEATIPFRGNFSTELYQKLQETNNKLKLGLTEQEIEETIKSAVRLSNKDVGGFAATESVVFLDNTWNLLPETNHNLYNHTSYTITEYRIALEKTEGFLNFLEPDTIFPCFCGEPSQENYALMVRRARHNLDVARLYLLTKIVTISLFEAISLRIGRGITLSSLVGEMPSQTETNFRLVNFLYNDTEFHAKNGEEYTGTEQEVLSLLEQGRSKSFGYDIKESPMSAFLVRKIGFDSIRHLRKQATEFFQEKISGEELISQYPPEIVETTIAGIVQVIDTRKNRILGN